MSLVQLQQPLRAAGSAFLRAALALHLSQSGRQLGRNNLNVILESRRHASVKAQGQYKVKPKRTHPNKLGAKRTGDQYVIPGNIIYKQRGTLWWPGENCFMGRDHTIHAEVAGYVKYYRDAARHPDRKYIGVVFDRKDSLPYPRHAERKRKLNMNAFPIKEHAPVPEMSPSGIPMVVERTVAQKINGLQQPNKLLRLRKDYSYREDNWRIGRLVQTTGLQMRKHRSRRAHFRARRREREAMIAGEKKAAARRAELGEVVTVKTPAKAKKASKKSGKAVAGRSKGRS